MTDPPVPAAPGRDPIAPGAALLAQSAQPPPAPAEGASP